MPLQNRVDPFGAIIRTPARGTIMGNRGGCIHNARQVIVRPFKSHRWITCVLEFKNRHRVVMTPNLYTELFFLDEATSFAAGHRPCAECRRDRYNAYRAAWGSPLPSAGQMDDVLHPARIDTNRAKVTWLAPLASLPDGTFVEIDRSPYLLWNGAIHLWTPSAYTDRVPLPTASIVTVLTPEPTVACLRNGYVPAVHPSAVR